jgi:hypothetical protein
VRDSGLEYRLVRAAWFAQNFSEGYLREPALAGVVALPAGEVREPIVDADDIAEPPVAHLLEVGKLEADDVLIARQLFGVDAALQVEHEQLDVQVRVRHRRTTPYRRGCSPTPTGRGRRLKRKRDRVRPRVSPGPQRNSGF